MIRLGLVTVGFAATLAGCIYVQPQSRPVAVVETPVATEQPASASPSVVETTVVTEPVYQAPPPEVAPVYQTELAPYGQWIVEPRYGRCWRPTGVAYAWQPYTVGHWVYTNDGCCTWVSDDQEVQWGGIVYHYGQWVRVDVGWIWVPGVTYAPAWVAWREGDGYCGWAPLPPEAVYGGQVTYVQADRYCPADQYVYLDEHHFNDRRADQLIVRNNVRIIHNTTNITNITVVNKTVINNGVPAGTIEHVTNRRVERVAIGHADNADQARRMNAQGTPVQYSTPAIEQTRDTVIAQRKAEQLKQVEDAKQAAAQKQAAHQQQVDADRQAQKDKQLAHQQEVNAAEQAKREKAAEQQRETQARQQAAQAEHQQQLEAQRQAAQAAQAERQQQAEAQRQGARQAQQDRAADRTRQAQEAKDAAAERRDKSKPKPDQPQTPPQPQ